MSFEGGWGAPARYTLYFFCGVRPSGYLKWGRWQSKKSRISRTPGTGTSEGGDTRARPRQSPWRLRHLRQSQNRVVEMLHGVPFISVDQARRNLGANDHSIRRAPYARKLWADALA